MGRHPGEQVEWRRLPDPGKLALFSVDEPQKFIGVAVCDDSLSQVDRQVRALEAAETFKKHASGLKKTIVRLVDAVGGNPGELLVGAHRQDGQVEVMAVPFTTPALQEQARANEAAATIEVPRRANNLFQLPRKEEPRVNRTTPEWRHAENERLSAIPPESWSETERIWMCGYEVMGDYMPDWMRSA